MEYIVVKGNVTPSHQITDLGIEVEFGTEVLIPKDRAHRSVDFSHAIQSKSVLRVGSRKKATLEKKAPVLEARMQRPKPVVVKDLLTKQQAKVHLSQKSASLDDKYEKLLKSHEDLIEIQKDLCNRMDLLIDVLSKQPSSTYAYPRPTEIQDAKPIVMDEWDEEEPIIFIPSNIRSEDTKVSEGFEVVEHVTESSNKMEDASKMLGSMTKKRRKKKSTTNSKT